MGVDQGSFVSHTPNAPNVSNAPSVENLKAIFLTCLGFFAWTVSDTMGKFFTTLYPPLLVMFLGNFSVLVLVSSYLFLKQGADGFKTPNLKWHLVRGACGLITGILVINALQDISLDVFYTIIFLAPLWVTFMTGIFLQDKIGWQRLVAILFGFAVVVYMFRPGGDVFGFGAFLVLGASFSFAGSMYAVRAMKTKDHPALLAWFYPMLSLVIMPPILWAQGMFQPVALMDLVLIFAMGGIVMAGLILTGLGFQIASSSSVVAPFHYTQIIWGVVLGYLVFGDIPVTEVLIGAGLLILSGIYLIWFERQESRKYAQTAVAKTDGLIS